LGLTQRRKVATVGVSLSPGKLRKHELLKNPPNPFGTKRKVAGKDRFGLCLCRSPSRSLKTILSTIFVGLKLAIVPARWDLGHEANPKTPKPMKESPGLVLRSGSELSSLR
jgi:hypothetical protein